MTVQIHLSILLAIDDFLPILTDRWDLYVLTNNTTDDAQSGRLKSLEPTILRYLKKHPKSQPALVLRLVLLERLGSPEPPLLRAFQEVKATGELSSRSAWWINSALRDMQRCELFIQGIHMKCANSVVNGRGSTAGIVSILLGGATRSTGSRRTGLPSRCCCLGYNRHGHFKSKDV